jgi:hypothetical protein
MSTRFPILATLGAIAAAALALVANSGDAQTPTGRTLTLFENTARESDTLVDNAPKSPVANPGDRRFRLSAGDELTVRTPVLDHRNGNHVGTLYAHVVVAAGNRFRNAVLPAQTILALGDGTIVMAGLAGETQRPFAVLGGTGAYEGARGSASETDTRGGAELSIRLQP